MPERRCLGGVRGLPAVVDLLNNLPYLGRLGIVGGRCRGSESGGGKEGKISQDVLHGANLINFFRTFNIWCVFFVEVYWLLTSDNLIDWHHTAINFQRRFKGQEELRRVWAPQSIYDPDEGKMMVYWSMKHGDDGTDIIYYAYTNPEFTDFVTEPAVFFTPSDGRSRIDGDIAVDSKGLYHLFYKTEGHGNGIRSAVAPTLAGDKWVETEGYKQQTADAVEGAGTFKLIGQDKYILMYDVYMAGRYQFCETTDLDTFRVVDADVTMDFHPRHGTVIAISSEEYKRLIEKWQNH